MAALSQRLSHSGSLTAAVSQRLSHSGCLTAAVSQRLSHSGCLNSTASILRPRAAACRTVTALTAWRLSEQRLSRRGDAERGAATRSEARRRGAKRRGAEAWRRIAQLQVGVSHSNRSRGVAAGEGGSCLVRRGGGCLVRRGDAERSDAEPRRSGVPHSCRAAYRTAAGRRVAQLQGGGR